MVPRSHDLRRMVIEKVSRGSAGVVSTGFSLDEVNRIIRAIDPEQAVESHEVYAHDTPNRPEMRRRLAELAGLDNYDVPPGSQGRPYNNDELAQILETLEEGDDA